jgi:hypothetical protein
MPSVVVKKIMSQQDDARSITHYLGQVFRKVVRLVIGSVSLPALVDILKNLYVEEAQRKLEREGSKPTKSAIALMTGLDTRVVSALMDQDDAEVQSQNVNPEHSLIDMWSSDPLFRDPDTGQPASLPIVGKGRTFQTLVLRSIGRNVTVKTVIGRLLASGNVRVMQEDVEKVELLSLIYSPISSDKAKQTEVGLIEASRVLTAVIHNMRSDPEVRVPQQGRWTYRLDPSRYKEFRKRARTLLDKQIREGEMLLEEFEEAAKETGQITVGIGWYQWGDRDPIEKKTCD